MQSVDRIVERVGLVEEGRLRKLDFDIFFRDAALFDDFTNRFREA